MCVWMYVDAKVAWVMVQTSDTGGHCIGEFDGEIHLANPLLPILCVGTVGVWMYVDARVAWVVQN